MFKKITQINEFALMIDFGSIVSIDINEYVNNFANYVHEEINNTNNKLQIINCVPSYNKILIQFNPLIDNKYKIISYLKQINLKKKYINKIDTDFIEIPICYDSIFSLDLHDISKKLSISQNEIINLHLNTEFHVYMNGFMPGLPFMGDLDSRLYLERKLTPRISLEKGSVGIVNKFCVIYPNTSPGGWNIIGRTPVNLFNKEISEPCLINAGKKVRFKKINLSQFNKMEKDLDGV
jgi:KipI family sensor histidine kinase inhibitor